MSGEVIFLTHADVAIDSMVPVSEWGLNDTGRARHQAFANTGTLDNVTAVFSSTERKAREGATPAANRLGIEVQTRVDLGEYDRSATGYLPEAEFWSVVAAFFEHPDISARGWETARAAQRRIVKAVKAVTAEAPPQGDILIVAHGGVGNLLRCALLGQDISQHEGQPHAKGGCWFRFSRRVETEPTQWRAI